MGTLVDTVRGLSGASASDASDARIQEALAASAVRLDAAWSRWSDNPALGRVVDLRLGRYRIEATADAGADNAMPPVTLANGAGDALTGFAVDTTGRVTFDDVDMQRVAVFATGAAYDVHAAAAEIVGVMIAAAAGEYDFKRGDQDFRRSQRFEHLEKLRRSLAARAVPRRRGAMTMRDQAPC